MFGVSLDRPALCHRFWYASFFGGGALLTCLVGFVQAQFNYQLAASGYDLDKWRSSKLTFSEAELEILDANGEPPILTHFAAGLNSGIAMIRC